MTTCGRSSSRPHGMEPSGAYDRQTAIEMDCHKEYSETDRFWFSYENETPILTGSTPPCAIPTEFDLLVDLSESPVPAVPRAPVEFAKPLADPFSESKDRWSASTAAAGPSDATFVIDDLLGEQSSFNNLLNVDALSSIYCSASAPNIQTSSAGLDPLAEFLSQFTSSTGSTQASTASSSSTTSLPSRAEFSQMALENRNSSLAPKPKVTRDVFGDLLSSHGFTPSWKNAARTLGDLKRAEEVKEMDPVAVKIRDWTGGKERNIRALLSSLSDVLWEGAENWEQPQMKDLLGAAQVKRNYHKACLVVHPDKQVGKPHEKLARAIFTELNDAWNAFEQAGN